MFHWNPPRLERFCKFAPQATCATLALPGVSANAPVIVSESNEGPCLSPSISEDRRGDALTSSHCAGSWIVLHFRTGSPSEGCSHGHSGEHEAGMAIRRVRGGHA